MSFVLVHGAGMGASCWDRLVPRLTGRVVAVDLPGRGERADIDLRTVTLEDCADAIVADVEREDVTDIVLVAHSFAGVSVPRVLDRLQDRVRHVVFLAAVVPPDGTAVIDGIDPAVRDIVKASIVDGRYVQGPEGAQAMLCNDMDDEQTAWTLEQLVDDSGALLTETVDLSGLRVDVPRTYIRTARDTCYPPELQEASSALVRAGAGSGHVVHMDSGHMPMISAPDRLATLLDSLSAD
ncbi:alpha/beta fold hydrolase [Rhodococcus sp. SORGH_AS_0301]|uniref:alpha/beta fold hydrolase n=1 Tax=Rhodococcus sp. SORGH_AS_0301 TaxID=3041780 RepID=UPI002788F064|nr:alpha/beta fold hydrolase [Rhodococcus sp. SORGH_AS_0301]MDQ1181689.1 pimeloyl-ACP methyl ester carboxylesterase [Rhodococcus sp. SORGH_AS_0301]